MMVFKKTSPKKRMANQAVSQAMALAHANSGKLKSVKIKIKFNGDKKKPAQKRVSGRGYRGGY